VGKAVRLGSHIGVAGGLDKAPAVAQRIGCEVLQIFSKSPQMWKGVPITDAVADGFRSGVRSAGLTDPAVHHGYLLNLATPKPGPRATSRTAFRDELERAEKIGAEYLIFHPGAHLGSGVEAGLAELVQGLDDVFDATGGFHVRALLENSAGQGTTLCSTFEELNEVLRRLKSPKRAGVALDTCHLFAKGFDFRTAAGYESLKGSIEATFGVDAVRAFHLNDAKAPLGSHLDRHENIGHGELGVDGFRYLLNDRTWSDRPGYLETPLGEDDYGAYERDLATLRGLLSGAPKKPASRRRAAPRSSTSK
jgi:deoxyribonuclease IV